MGDTMHGNNQNSPTKLCTSGGCSKPLRARGLCATHYNQIHQPNRHAKVMVPCDCCGGLTPKEVRSGRYVGVYCSTVCRDFTRWGHGQACRIPADHWARWYGRTSDWVAPVTRNTGACEWCGGANNRGRLASFCSNACKKARHKASRRAKEHNAPGSYTWAQVVRLWVGMGKRCAYCDTRTRLSDIQAEHVIPLSRGGENHVGNILPSCGPCNADKRDLFLHEWNADRARRGLTPVRTSWTDDDARFAHLSRTPFRLAA